MSADVSLLRCGDYDSAKVKKSVEKLVDRLGGMGKFVKNGETVLLKPNLLTAAKPEQAVTTHPAVVRAVAEMVIDAGGKPFIADSPALSNFKKTARTSGIRAVADELGIPMHELGESVERKQDEKKIYRILEISRQALDADRIINLPKLKTHVQMFMTLGVKNIFGCVVGKRKSQWHLKAGIDSMFFARMIVELYSAVSPDLTILDGILGMEGDGPGTGGRPKKCGLLAASSDAVALDRVVLEIVGADPGRLYTNEVAAEYGVGETDLSRINVMGDAIGSCKVKRFNFPKRADLIPVPKLLRKIMINHLTAKPVDDRSKCTMCKQCIDACPADVISGENEFLVYNYDKCIRCYCCVEICPEGAMKRSVPLLSRIMIR